MYKTRYFKSGGNNPLTPITSDWMHNILGDFATVERLMKTYGSPINLHHIPSFRKNIREFQNVFDNWDVDGQIYFARKANKSSSLVKAALDFGIGVDTASYKELEQAISLGGNYKNLVSTAAVKTRSLMGLALKDKIPVIIDNHDELLLVQEMAAELKINANIGIRMSGFTVAQSKLYSRFGFDIELDRSQLLEWFGKQTRFPNLSLSGLHLHLDGYSIEQRGEAIHQCLDFINEFTAAGIHLKFLDIGGGILMNYLESKEEWDSFKVRLQESVLGKKPPITFSNKGLGYEKSESGNKISGKLNTYPYFSKVHGAKFLEEILCYKNNFQETVAMRLKEQSIQLRIEPGRSLLDQVGMTLARVIHRKKDSEGNWLVGLEMNMSQLKSSSADFLLDPFIMFKKPTTEQREMALFFTGAYCLEQDIILKRKLYFPKVPDIGDFAIFVNTAGYMMHFYETEAHLFDLSRNLYLPENADESNAFLEDETVLDVLGYKDFSKESLTQDL